MKHDKSRLYQHGPLKRTEKYIAREDSGNTSRALVFRVGMARATPAVFSSKRFGKLKEKKANDFQKHDRLSPGLKYYVAFSVASSWKFSTAFCGAQWDSVSYSTRKHFSRRYVKFYARTTRIRIIPSDQHFPRKYPNF